MAAAEERTGAGDRGDEQGLPPGAAGASPDPGERIAKAVGEDGAGHPAEVPAPAASEKVTPEPEAPPPVKRARGLRGWVGKRAKKVVKSLYDSRADELEERARRVVSSAYKDSAEDIEERAVRAMRRAIQLEADRIKEVIEHSVRVKKREVRLSLIVLVTASLVYLLLYWVTHRGATT